MTLSFFTRRFGFASRRLGLFLDYDAWTDARHDERVLVGLSKLGQHVLSRQGRNELPLALFTNVLPNDVVRDDVLIPLEHFEKGQE